MNANIGSQLPESEKLEAEKALIRNTFAEVNNRHGFTQTRETPPYPSPDDTVLFIGAQISLWKPRLDAIRAGDEGPSYCAQDCVRLQNKDAFLAPEPITYNSYFRAHGAIAPATGFETMVAQAEEFLTEIGIPNERLIIKTDSVLSKKFSSDSLVLIDSRQPEYYSWTYGDPNLRGHGITFAIASEYDDTHFDIGNVILISKDHIPSVVEWGFGEETLITAIHSDKIAVKYSRVPNQLRELLITTRGIKYIDALTTSIRTAHLGIQAGERGAGDVLNEYLRCSAFLASLLRKSIISVSSDIESIAETHAISGTAVEHVTDKVHHHLGRISYFSTMTKRALQNESDPDVSLGRKIGLPQNITQAIIMEVSNQSKGH